MHQELTPTTSKKVREENGWTWEYISENEAEIWKFLAPVWGWLYRALENLPEGQCVKLAVPEGKDLKKVRNRIACSVRQQFIEVRWRVRCSDDQKHLVIIHNGTWKALLDKKRKSHPFLNSPTTS